MKKYIHITSGRGPIECQYVVAKVLGMIVAILKSEGVKSTIVQSEKGQENGTTESATLMLEDIYDLQFLSEWIGTILWIEKSQFRKNEKRKNWYISVKEIRDFKQVNFSESDITIQTMRSNGPGGQNVNKVNSAVRVKHTPTGVTAFSQESRSQHQNRQIAIERLKEKLNEGNLKSIKNQIVECWSQHDLLERGNPIKTIVGEKFRKQNITKKYRREQFDKQKWHDLNE